MFDSLYMVETLTAGTTGFGAPELYTECKAKMGSDFANFYVALYEQLSNTHRTWIGFGIIGIRNKTHVKLCTVFPQNLTFTHNLRDWWTRSLLIEAASLIDEQSNTISIHRLTHKSNPNYLGHIKEKSFREEIERAVLDILNQRRFQQLYKLVRSQLLVHKPIPKRDSDGRAVFRGQQNAFSVWTMLCLLNSIQDILKSIAKHYGVKGFVECDFFVPAEKGYQRPQ